MFPKVTSECLTVWLKLLFLKHAELLQSGHLVNLKEGLIWIIQTGSIQVDNQVS